MRLRTERDLLAGRKDPLSDQRWKTETENFASAAAASVVIIVLVVVTRFLAAFFSPRDFKTRQGYVRSVIENGLPCPRVTQPMR